MEMRNLFHRNNGGRHVRVRALIQGSLAGLIGLVMVACSTNATPSKPKASSHSHTTKSESTLSSTSSTPVIHVGVILPLTGSIAAEGQVMRNGYEIAAKDINNTGGVQAFHNAKIKLTFYDNASSTSRDVTVANQAIGAHPSVITGGMGSTLVLASTAIVSKAGIPYITDTAQANNLTARGLKYVFDTVADGEQVAQTDVGLMASLSSPSGQAVHRLVVMHTNDAYGNSVADSIAKLAPQHGIRVIDSVGYPPSVTNLSSQAQRIASEKPDYVLIVGYTPDTALAVQALANAHVHVLGISGETGAYDPDFLKIVGGLANDIFAASQVNVNTKSGPGATGLESFAKEYQAQFHQPAQPYAAEGFSTIYLIKKAVGIAQSAKPAKIAAALRHITFTSKDGSLLPYTLRFTSTGAPQHVSAVEVQYQHGQWRTVWPRSAATAKPIFPLPATWWKG